MLFNSFSFAIFLAFVFVAYWLLKRVSLTAQNVLLFTASYFFYGCWDWRFLGLIAFSSAVDFYAAIKIDTTDDPHLRKSFLWFSLVCNLGVLGVFKYFGFFAESLKTLLQSIGLAADFPTLSIILPVGISFYTFQSLSYTIDVYRREISATRNLLQYFTYVSFFPQLVAGPIERAVHLLPQFATPRTLDLAQAKDGLRQILWGLLKKVVIADNLAGMVDHIFTNSQQHNGITLLLGAIYFAIQIYCDFSGYSDMAIGAARLFGFDLMRNFAYPYFSRDIGEFWRCWHISLSTWFRDYVYIPLGGNRVGSRGRHMAVLLATFTVSGLWHGAAWTFVVWGLINGLFYLPLVLRREQKRYPAVVAAGRWFPNISEMRQMGTTFLFVLVGWIFFRSASLENALDYFHRLLTTFGGSPKMTRGIPYVVLLLGIEWFQRNKAHALQLANASPVVRWSVYYVVILLVFWFGNTGHVPFIYFQF